MASISVNMSTNHVVYHHIHLMYTHTVTHVRAL